jgi:uncharacterized protein YxeA
MYCYKCGNESAEGSIFCPVCGANLNQQPVTEKNNFMKKILIGVVLILAVILIVVLLFAFRKPKENMPDVAADVDTETEASEAEPVTETEEESEEETDMQYDVVTYTLSYVSDCDRYDFTMNYTSQSSGDVRVTYDYAYKDDEEHWEINGTFSDDTNLMQSGKGTMAFEDGTIASYEISISAGIPSSMDFMVDDYELYLTNGDISAADEEKMKEWDDTQTIASIGECLEDYFSGYTEGYVNIAISEDYSPYVPDDDMENPETYTNFENAEMAMEALELWNLSNTMLTSSNWENGVVIVMLDVQTGEVTYVGSAQYYNADGSTIK